MAIQNWWPASHITTDVDSLKEIDGAELTNGDRAIVITGEVVYFYRLEDPSAVVEDIPNAIVPTVNAGSKTWILVGKTPDNFLLVQKYPKNETLNNIVYSVEVTENNCFIFGGEYNSLLVNDGETNNGIINSNSGLLAFNWGSNLISGEGNGIINGINSNILGGSNNFLYNSDGFLEGNIIVNCEESFLFGSEFCSFIGVKNSLCLGCNEVCFSSGSYLASYSVKKGLSTGKGGVLFIDGQQVFGGGSRYSLNPMENGNNFKGDIQSSTLLLGGTTTDATESELLIDPGIEEDNLNSRIYLKEDKTWSFKITVAARQIAGSGGSIGDSAFWVLTGGFKNIGSIRAEGTITFNGAMDVDVPSAEETFTINEETYIWRDSPNLVPMMINNEIPLNTYGETPTKESCLQSLAQAFYLTNKFAVSSMDSSSITLVALPHQGVGPNSWEFTENCSNMIMDGSGNFGGTTAGASGTVSFFGTPQGAGVPETNNRDAAAAAWEVNLDAADSELLILVTGEADKTIHWTAKIELVEVA